MVPLFFTSKVMISLRVSKPWVYSMMENLTTPHCCVSQATVKHILLWICLMGDLRRIVGTLNFSKKKNQQMKSQRMRKVMKNQSMNRSFQDKLTKRWRKTAKVNIGIKMAQYTMGHGKITERLTKIPSEYQNLIFNY